MKREKCMTYTLLDTTECFDRSEYEDWCRDNDTEPTDEGFYNWSYDLRSMYVDDFWTDMENVEETPVCVDGLLGLWCGRRRVRACFDTIEKAIKVCLDGMDEAIVKMENGVLKVTGIHHDGRNCFDIRPLSKKGLDKYCRDGEISDADYNLAKFHGYLF